MQTMKRQGAADPPPSMSFDSRKQMFFNSLNLIVVFVEKILLKKRFNNRDESGI